MYVEKGEKDIRLQKSLQSLLKRTKMADVYHKTNKSSSVKKEDKQPDH
jgi:hypothetical protein